MAQSSMEVDPGACVVEFAGQLVHAFGLTEYVPIGHSSHSPLVFVNDPGEHFPASDPSVEFAGKTVSALFSSTGHAVP